MKPISTCMQTYQYIYIYIYTNTSTHITHCLPLSLSSVKPSSSCPKPLFINSGFSAAKTTSDHGEAKDPQNRKKNLGPKGENTERKTDRARERACF